VHNAIRIIISGGIATVVQRTMELNPISLIGFTLFVVIFAIVSGIITYFFPAKDNKDENQSQISYLTKISKVFNIVKVVTILTIGYLVINTAVNYISVKSGWLDGNFKYPKTNQAVVITITDKPILSYKVMYGTNVYQSLFKRNNRYYLLKTIGIPKMGDKIVTRFSEFSLGKLYKNCKNRDDIEDILKNISNVGFAQIDDIELPFKTYWYFNNYKQSISFGDDIRDSYLKKLVKIIVPRSSY